MHSHNTSTLLVPRCVDGVTSCRLEQQCDFFCLVLFCCSSKKSLHPLPPESHPAAARSMKLLAKIPKDAEAVIVLVGKLGELRHSGLARKEGIMSLLSPLFL